MRGVKPCALPYEASWLYDYNTKSLAAMSLAAIARR